MNRNKKAGARKKRGARSSGKSSKPVQIGMQLRLALTLSIAALFVWGLYSLARVDTNRAVANRPAQSGQLDSSPAQSENGEYTFYSRLRDFEIDVSGANESPAQHKTTRAVSYLIQAGSFKTRTQADQLRAELILLGLEPQVEKSVNSRGETWYRIKLGPYDSRSTMAGVRSTLIDNHIDALVMQRKS